MLKIYNPTNASDVIPFPIDDDKRYVTHTYDGRDTLNFEIASSNPLYRYIVEETRIADEKNIYAVKLVDEHSTFVTVRADLDLDEWRSTIIYEFRRTNATLLSVLQEILPAGWSIDANGNDITSKRTTIEDNEGEPLCAVTPLDILTKSTESWGYLYNFDTLYRTLKVIDPDGYASSGQFFMEDLNLRDIGFVGDSSDFATRLYAFGAKDENGTPMTFASVNNGLPYVEDFSYSDKVVCVGWSDERYTVPESLLADAMVKLKQISRPSRSYTCEAYNLGGDIEMYRVVTLIDQMHRTSVEHQIVEWNEYPNHIRDTITLSKTAPSVSSSLSGVQSSATAKIDETSVYMQELIEQAVDVATAKISGENGGNFRWIYDRRDRPIALVQMCDSDDLETAQQVWVWNIAGLGHSKTGYGGEVLEVLLPDGSVNATAITTGTFLATLIKAGILSDRQSAASWDMETGRLRLPVGTLIGAEGEEQTFAQYIETFIPEIPVVPTITTYVDAGESIIGETGMVEVSLGDAFLQEMADCGTETYQVFLQGYAAGSLYVGSRSETSFEVRGTVGAKFGWQAIAKRPEEG